MSIRIDKANCIGCGFCVEACPGNLIALVDSKAEMKSIRDCWGCTACMKECPVSAIGYFLGVDIGGAGAIMHIEREGSLYHWKVDFSDGTQKTITVDRKNANKY